VPSSGAATAGVAFDASAARHFLNATSPPPPSSSPSSLPPSDLWFRYDPSACGSLASLASFVSHPAHANGMANRQVRMLAGALLDPHELDPRPIDQL
jgi:hypothetical protein